MPSAILSWTDRWIAIDKSAGLPSRPGPGHASSGLTVLEEWLSREAPESPAPGVVHRIDLGTSGVLLFSLGPEAHRAIVRAFFERRVRKEYRALVSGWPQPRRGMIDLPLRRNASGRIVPDRRGSCARTRYETLRRFEGAALLRLEPQTGRMHQIRAHLAARGTPVIGDVLYGGPPYPGPFTRRICLHSRRLALPAKLVEALQPLILSGPGVGPDGAWVIEAPEPIEFLNVASGLRRAPSR